MRVALVGAEHEENLAIRYIRGALEGQRHQVGQIAFNDPTQLEDAARDIAAGEFELVGISMVFTARAREFASLAERARQLGCSALLVAGGHFAAFNAEALLAAVNALDAVVLGEGEGPMLELAAGTDPSKVRGLVLRRASGTVRTGPARLTADLDTLAWPSRKQPFDEFLGRPIVNMLSSRGCTHSCAFCSIAAWHRLCGGARHRCRKAEAVADEMAALRRQGVRIFNFHDDNFLPRGRDAVLGRLGALLAALKQQRLGRIALAVKSRPDAIDPEVLAALQKLGVFRLFLGIEAGSDAALGYLGRRQTLSANHRALDLINARGLHACYNLLLFNPDSSLQDIGENLRFLRAHPDNPMNFCRTEVYAGTPLERRLLREGRLLGDFWGRYYRIADPRAQRAFEIALQAFSERNYGRGPTALHHLAMRVDFELQLLEHFSGTRRLRPAAKDFVRQVNASTCELLERLVGSIARAPRLPSIDGCMAADLAASVAESNCRLGAEGTALIDEISAAAVRGARANGDRRWSKRAAAAGLAATLSLSGVACRETVPGTGTQPSEMVAQPLEGDPARIRAPLGTLLLPRIARLLSRPMDIEVTVMIGADGSLAWCTFKVENGESQRCPPVHYQPGAQDLRNRRFHLRYSAEELARASSVPLRPDAGATQIYEEAPTPRRPDAGRPTHPHEMIPRPAPPGPKKPAPKKPPAKKKTRPEKDKTHDKEMAPYPFVPGKKS